MKKVVIHAGKRIHFRKRKKKKKKELTENINTLSQTTCIVLQWIPAHTGIRGNEVADQLEKERRKKEQPPSHLSYRIVKTLICNKKKAIFHCKTGGYIPNQDALDQLPQHQQTNIFAVSQCGRHCDIVGDIVTL